MARSEKLIVTHTCDSCGQEYPNGGAKLELEIKGAGRDVGPTILYGTFYIEEPYAPSMFGKDICNACLVGYLKRWIKEMERE